MKEKNITIIVAAAENDAIGKNNDLIWSLPNDLKRFKKLTSGHCIIMGRNCLLYTSPSPRDGLLSRMPSSA